MIELFYKNKQLKFLVIKLPLSILFLILFAELLSFSLSNHRAVRHDLDKKVDNKSLSSGQMQKLAFIRALLADVEILLLDESTANLDTKSRDLIFDILKKQNVTIVNSTHDPKYFKNVDHNLNIEIIEEKRVLIFN